MTKRKSRPLTNPLKKSRSIDESHRVFVPGKDEQERYGVVCCDPSVLEHSPFFSLMFEVNKGPITITRSFRLFEKVLQFARFPTKRLRLLYDEGEKLVTELDYYGIMTSEEIQRLQQGQWRFDVIEKMYKLNFSRESGFDDLLGRISQREDVSSNEKHLILQLFVRQAWMHITNYDGQGRERWVNKPNEDKLIDWFKNPDESEGKMAANDKMPHYKHVSWSIFSIRDLLTEKKQLITDIMTKFPNARLETSGINHLFHAPCDCWSNIRGTTYTNIRKSMHAVIHDIKRVLPQTYEMDTTNFQNIHLWLRYPERCLDASLDT